MNKRENLLSIFRRQGYETIPVHYGMCPSLKERFDAYCKEHELDFDIEPAYESLSWIEPAPYDRQAYWKYYDVDFKEGTYLDPMGVAHEPGSEAAFHMTRMYHPMEHFDSVEQIEAYPFLDYTGISGEKQAEEVKKLHKRGLAACGNMQCTVWETSWYLRGMENLMMDMMCEDPMAEVLLDKITDMAVKKAVIYAEAGADLLFLGDDIGMQNSIMMSEQLYCDWLKPRIAKVIEKAKEAKPDILVLYHSCGYVTPFIPHLIEAGVDVLNPIQPECMDFQEIHDAYGEQLSFHGTIGTQTTMPYGTADDVRRAVFQNLDIAGRKGGLLAAPTHLLEPEVPVENGLAYLKACSDYTK